MSILILLQEEQDEQDIVEEWKMYASEMKTMNLWHNQERQLTFASGRSEN